VTSFIQMSLPDKHTQSVMKKFMINTTSAEKCTGGSEREQKVTRHASLSGRQMNNKSKQKISTEMSDVTVKN